MVTWVTVLCRWCVGRWAQFGAIFENFHKYDSTLQALRHTISWDSPPNEKLTQ